MAQIDNQELVRNLTPHFHKRSDLALNLAHSISFMQAVSGVVGIWPHADRDIGGLGQNLTGSGTIKTIQYDNNIVPYALYDQAGAAFTFIADNTFFDITGAEAHVGSSSQGLTMGGWWQISNAGSIEDLMAKWDTGQKSYILQKNATENLSIVISVDGSANSTTYTTTYTVSPDTWFYAVVWYNPSTELGIYYGLSTDNDLTYESTTTSVAASLFNGTADFTLGTHDNGTDYLDGRSSMTFLVRGRLPEIYIETFFDLTSPLFAST
jgi:hypothetical protein